MTVVTCGDAAAGQLTAAGLADDVIVWRDILHEGPVPDGADPAELNAVRARYLAEQGWTTEDEALRDFATRDERLPAATSITLWFDENLVNQLQLIQILAVLSTVDTKELWLTGPRTFGGVGPQALIALHEARQPVTAAHLELGTQAWAAFRADRPERLAALASGPTDPLPALAPALTRLLRQYPSTRDGLSLTERRALAAIATGLTGFADIFLAQARDDPPFLGDAVLRGYLDRLAGGVQPLLEIDDAGRYRLTITGGRVLDGRADQIALNGIDRWYGGVHLRGSTVWRWDDQQRRLIR